MRISILFFLFYSSVTLSQQLIIGNNSKVCLEQDSNIFIAVTLPLNISKYKSIIIFSSATSVLTKEDAISIQKFVEDGGGLYIGAENWPLQAESRQLTDLLFGKELYGINKATNATSKDEYSNLKLSEFDSIPAGKTTVAFPLDYRLKVEAWLNDQPLILSGNYKKGRIIIDGGYSRFYCENMSKTSSELWLRFKSFLVKKK